MHLLAAVLAVCLQAQPVQGQRKQEVRQPEEFEVLRTKTGYVLPQMVFEGDASVQFLWFTDFDDDDVDIDFRAFVFEGAFGILPWLTGEIEVPILSLDADPGDSESGIGDIIFEAKASLREGLGPIGLIPFDLAVGLRLTAPTGDEDEGLGRENASLAPFVAASHRFEPWVAVHAEIFFEVQEDERPQHGINLAGDFTPWTPEFSLLGAINIRRDGTHRSEVLLIPGAEYRFGGASPRFAIGASLPIGLNDDSPDWGIFLNFQVAFGP